MDILGFEAGNVFNNCTQEGNIGINYIQMSEKLIENLKNPLQNAGGFGYNISCCDMIAMKREVAAHSLQVLRGANVM